MNRRTVERADRPGDPGESGRAEDGRVRRGARNREAILEALYELIAAGDLRPTAEELAARAGVGTRTVFRHFTDMESLFAEMTTRVEREVRPILEQALPEGTLDQRVRALVARRAGLFERIAPFKRSGVPDRWRSKFLQRSHAEMVRRLRAELHRAMPELSKAPAPVVEGIDLLTSFEAWDRLRCDQRLSRERAQSAVERAVLGLLRQAGLAEG